MAAKKELLLIEIREDGARVVKRNIEGVGKAGDKTAGQMDKLKTVIAGVVSLQALRRTIMLADSYANMLNRLRVVTTGTWELHAAMEAVFKMSRETRTALEANVDMYSRIAINTKQMGLNMRDVVRFATQLNHAIILSGVTAREAQWGMVQFSQGLAAGALRGDELRAVMEQLPIVTETLTRYMGIGRGELRKWAFEGRVTTRVIIDAFNEAEKSLAERFGRRIPTVDQALTVLVNSITKFVGGLDQAVQGTGRLATAILWLSDNMNVLGRVVAVVGAVLGTILLKNLIGIVAQMRLFSLAILSVNPIATILFAAGAAAVVFSDKIKIAKDSSATLKDVFKALGEEVVVAYKAIREGITDLISGIDIQTEFETTLESILMDLATFADRFMGVFHGIGRVIEAVFNDIPAHAKLAWNEILSSVEFLTDVFRSAFAAIGDNIRVFGLHIKSAMIALNASMQQLQLGDVKQAAFFADQAALSFKNAAAAGFKNFSNTFRENLAEAVSEDNMAGLKFEVEKSGETLGEAFFRGFDSTGFIAGGMMELLKRAKEIAARDVGGGPSAGQAAVFSPTPVQSQLLKDMIGDIGKVNNQMLQLKELWEAINTKQPGTEGMSATLDQVNRKMVELKLRGMAVNTDVISGFQRGFLTLGLEISNFAEMAEKTVTNAFKGMEDAMVKFVQTGKLDFKSLVDSMLADLTRLLFRQALVGLAGQMFSGGASGGLLGALAGNLSPAGGGGPIGPTPSGGNIAGRALGGSVSPGMSYMVGERGPEPFTPAQPGHITPNTAAIPAPAPEGDVVIINVSTEEAALAAMGSAEGKRIIRNEIRTYNK